MAAPAASDDLLVTPLNALHLELGARMVPFAGYDMPVQYKPGILKEHLHTRAAAGLFDVSHMGQAVLRGDAPAAAFERLVPGDIAGLEPGRMRYSLLLNDDGGILDDLMATRPDPGFVAGGTPDDALFLVVNAACKGADFDHIAGALSGVAELERLEDRALLALQGPQAASVLTRHAPEAGNLVFMQGASMKIAGVPVFVTRSGYTGEDGFEISIPAEAAEDFARALLAEPEVEAIGLGARDSLRLEAGLCLYGHDIDTTTTPIEAALAWTVSKSRREKADFPGAAVIMRQLSDGAPRRRVGLLPDGRAPVREGASITDGAGSAIGQVTSGGFAPSLERPVAMGYVAAAHAGPGSTVALDLRGRSVGAEVAKMPFVAPGYHRG